MSVPDFQTMMLPFLELLRNGNERTFSEIASGMATYFHLSEEETKEMIPSKRQTKLFNRIYWASIYLRRSKLIELPSRGQLKITSRGIDLLNEHPERIDMKTLERYPEYVEFRQRRNTTEAEKSPSVPIEPIESQTPDEVIAKEYEILRRTLAADILEKIKSCSPTFFEHLVVELLVKMGYGGTREDAGRAVGKSGDGGIDGIINEDRLGLDVIYIQAKRWENPVGGPEVQKFAGALQGKRARKGVFITTSDFTKAARDFAANIESKIILIDGDELAELMIDYNLGVSIQNTYEIKRIDSDYFTEE